MLDLFKNLNDQSSFYGMLHRCVRRVENGASRYLVYDGWNLIAEYDSSGVLTTKYIHGSRTDELLAKIDSSGAVYYLENALGSITSLTDANGNIVERYAYDAYGKASIYGANGSSLAASAYGNRFLFTGREWIEEANIYDYRNRSYSPELGRFLETDSISFAAGDVNLYRYVGNSVANYIDPFGLCYSKSFIGPLPSGECYCEDGGSVPGTGWGGGSGGGGKNPNSSHPHGYGGGNEFPPDGGGGSGGGFQGGGGSSGGGGASGTFGTSQVASASQGTATNSTTSNPSSIATATATTAAGAAAGYGAASAANSLASSILSNPVATTNFASGFLGSAVNGIAPSVATSFAEGVGATLGSAITTDAGGIVLGAAILLF